jgi:hypothetical protein
MSPIGIVLVVILALVLVGALGGPYVNPSWSYGYGYGHGGVGLVAILLVVIIVLAFTNRLPF